MSSYGDMTRNITDVVEDILVCECCGGKNVHTKVWININTKLPVGYCGDYEWCPDCQYETCVVTLAEYNRIFEEEMEEEKDNKEGL